MSESLNMRWKPHLTLPCKESEFHDTRGGVCVDCGLDVTGFDRWNDALLSVLHGWTPNFSKAEKMTRKQPPNLFPSNARSY